MTARLDNGAALRVDIADVVPNGSASPSSVSDTQNRLLQVSSGSGVKVNTSQDVQLRHKRTSSTGSCDNPFRPNSALSLEVDELMRSLRIVKDGDRLVLKIDQNDTNGDATRDRPIDAVDHNHKGSLDFQSESVVLPTSVARVECKPKPLSNGSPQTQTIKQKSDALHLQCGIVELANGSAVSGKPEKVRLSRSKHCSLL